jgi:protein-tyrosine-phosphatase
MAEAIARKLLSESVHVDSAGLETVGGLPAARYAITVMREMGLDLCHHRSKQIETLDLIRFGRVIAMTPCIAKCLVKLGVESARIVELDVSDPYGKSIEVYRSVANVIEERLHHVFDIPKRNEP